MKQHYFVVVLAHSLHGRLRRVHIPHQALYVVLGLAVIGSFSMFGAVSSYLRMTWKVANYNSLRDQVDTLRTKYQALLAENGQKEEQLVIAPKLSEVNRHPFSSGRDYTVGFCRG